MQPHTISNMPSSTISSSSCSSKSLHPKSQRHFHDSSKKQSEKLGDADMKAFAIGGADSGSASSRAFTERLAAKVQEVRNHFALQLPLRAGN